MAHSFGARLALAAAVLLGAGVAVADDVSSYLEQLGLTELLATHLEDQVDDARGEERDELVVRLAGLYAELLETAEDPVRRRQLEERSRRLLADASPETTEALRLALARASYRSVERVAENHRLRLVTADELDAARQSLAELIPELNRLRNEIDAHVDVASRRLSRATGTEATMLAEEAERAGELAAQATFLTAWALYYQSFLNNRPENARSAQKLFTDLLDFGNQAPVPENVSVDLRSVEAVARCILGMALCKSLTASTATALDWLELMEDEDAFPPLREQLPAWRMVVLLAADEFVAVETELDRFRATGEPAPLHWLRLVAVNALDAQSRSRYAAELARGVVTELAARGELQQVFDLAERFGTDGLGDSGFALLYVRGVLAYHAARAAHGNDRPTSDPELLAAYEDAIRSFAAAATEPDREQYPEALPDCTRLIAWSRYFQGELLEARIAFQRAADELGGATAAEALWMAIVCLDRLAEQERRGSALRGELEQLIARFLAEYPSSEHAPKLVLRQALDEENHTPRLAADLLAIPPNSSVHDAARRRGVQILYGLFRASRGAERYHHGTRFLETAVIMFAEAPAVAADDEAERRRTIVLGRRILEVALADRIGRVADARDVLREFDALAKTSPESLAGFEDELDYRRLRERSLSGDVDAAVVLADALTSRDASSVWARLANRSVFQDAAAAWRADELDPRLARRVVTFGDRVLSDSTALDTPSVIASATTVAEAGLASWTMTRDPGIGRRALARYEQLLGARPQTTSFLRGVAVLSAAVGEPDRAVECWRRLVAGLPAESAAWYEAKFHLVDVLAAVDVERARLVMGQHRDLHPEYGPEPWGTRLRQLDARLGAASRDEDATP